MAFFNSAVGVLQTLVVALGAGLGIWGAINLMEGYGNDNPGSKSQGMKQLMAGGGVALIGITLVPLLSGLGYYDHQCTGGSGFCDHSYIHSVSAGEGFTAAPVHNLKGKEAAEQGLKD